MLLNIQGVEVEGFELVGLDGVLDYLLLYLCSTINILFPSIASHS
jgi:hypothetical protein